MWRRRKRSGTRNELHAPLPPCIYKGDALMCGCMAMLDQAGGVERGRGGEGTGQRAGVGRQHPRLHGLHWGHTGAALRNAHQPLDALTNTHAAGMDREERRRGGERQGGREGRVQGPGAKVGRATPKGCTHTHTHTPRPHGWARAKAKQIWESTPPPQHHRVGCVCEGTTGPGGVMTYQPGWAHRHVPR